MSIRVAHLRIQGINCAIFAAQPRLDTEAGRNAVLAQLTHQARAAGLRVDKAALAYMQFGRPCFYGTPDLVRYLQNNGVDHWTHTLSE